MNFKSATVDHLRRILNKEGTYYPVIEGCDNPYRDGYVTEPPKKPRASYLIFQATVRTYMSKLHPKLPQAELMVMLGEAWRAMPDDEKTPWFELADEELKQYNKERILLEKAQKPNGVWQPIRRCLQVLNRLSNDSFADIFLEPVSAEDFPDYAEIIDIGMDLGTVRKRLEARKYQGPEQFARDMRRVRTNQELRNINEFLSSN
jgi:Bromodomain/HMG (high mobility group) box